jgi:hypothetical protein
MWKSALLVLFLLQSSSHAQTCDREVLVNVTNTKLLSQVADLKHSQFLAEFRNVPASIKSVEHFGVAPRVMILIDTSGSMADPPLNFSTSMIVASGLISFIDPKVEIAVGRFDDRFILMADFTADRNKLVREVQSQMPARRKWEGHQTFLFGAIDETLKAFGDIKLGDTLVVISDGADNRSRDPGKTRKRVHATPLRVYAAGVWNQKLMTQEEIHGPIDLQQLTEPSGGRTFGISVLERNDDERRKIMLATATWIAERINSSYKLTVSMPVELGKPLDWKLRVVNEQQKNVKDQSVEYPRKLLPCSGSRSMNTK